MACASTTTATTRVSEFLSARTRRPSPHKLQVAHKVQCINKLPTFAISHAKTYPLKLNHLLCFASSTSSTPAVEEDQENGTDSSADSDGDDGILLQSETSSLGQDSDTLSSLRGCEACGREEIERGCNGEGRIQGGIATVPGFGWWPIKAYRPCPAYVASGGRYKRRGQSMDEVTSGRIARAPSAATDDEARQSKKKQGAMKFNR